MLSEGISFLVERIRETMNIAFLNNNIKGVGGFYNE